MGFLYTLFIGIHYCVDMVTLGLLLCPTVIGIPLGLACIALGGQSRRPSMTGGDLFRGTDLSSSASPERQ
jgi:uncharacterized membrane protein YccF (DUF307 family)